MRWNEMHINAAVAAAASLQSSKLKQTHTATAHKKNRFKLSMQLFILKCTNVKAARLMRRRPANSSIALIHPTCTVHTSIIHAHRHIFCVILSSILDRVSMAHRENPPFAHIHMSFSLYALCRQCRLYILCDYLLFVRENLLSVLSSHDDECDPNSC